MMNWWWRRRAKPLELDVLDAYARWAGGYAPEAHNPLMQMEEQAVLELMPQTAGRWLDLACGSGRYLKQRASRDDDRAVGLDISRPMLARAASLGRPLV